MEHASEQSCVREPYDMVFLFVPGFKNPRSQSSSLPASHLPEISTTGRNKSNANNFRGPCARVRSMCYSFIIYILWMEEYQVILRTALNLAFPLFMCSRAFGASAKGNVSTMQFTPWICANLIASSLSRACPEGQP